MGLFRKKQWLIWTTCRWSVYFLHRYRNMEDPDGKLAECWVERSAFELYKEMLAEK
jgi:hypothetical protein